MEFELIMFLYWKTRYNAVLYFPNGEISTVKKKKRKKKRISTRISHVVVVAISMRYFNKKLEWTKRQRQLRYTGLDVCIITADAKCHWSRLRV